MRDSHQCPRCFEGIMGTLVTVPHLSSSVFEGIMGTLVTVPRLFWYATEDLRDL